MLYNILKAILKVILFFLVKIEKRNFQNIPKEGPLIIAANHLSMWDPIIIGVLFPRKVHFMAKEELFKVYLLKDLMRAIGTFPVKRGQADRNAIRKALKVLKNNEVLCIFPEGTRSKDGKLLDFHEGITLIANKGNSPILTMGIMNSNKILKSFFKRTKIIINIGEPLYIENIYKGKISSEELTGITKELHNKVNNLLL